MHFIVFMEPEIALKGFGLTEAEISLYLTLLKFGESTASSLAKHTNTNRTFTYDRLKKLIGTGMVSYLIKDSKKYFVAAEPNQLLSLLKEKEEQIKAVLPELENLKLKESNLPKVEVYSSKKGIRTVLNMLLKEKKDKEKKEILIHGTINGFVNVMGDFFEIWNKRRQNEKIKARILTNENVEVPFAELSLLNEEEHSSTTTFSSGNFTVIILWLHNPIGIMIENSEIAENNNAFFDSVWKREIKIYTGADGIRRAWMELVSKKSKELVGFGFSWAFAQIYGRDFSNKWHKERLKNKIPTRLIAYDDADSIKYFDVRMIEWKDFGIHFLDKLVSGPACVTISDHVMVTFLYTEKKYRVMLSYNKEMISIYKKHFEELWKISALK